MQAERLCINCGEVLVKPANLSQRNFLAKKYCNKECAAAATGNTIWAPGFDDSDSAAASFELLKRLVRFGWKNDGLPGLSAWEFRALAREIGVAA